MGTTAGLVPDRSDRIPFTDAKSNAMTEFPLPGMALTHILVASDIARSRDFYVGVLGADVYREYGGTSCVLSWLDTWILLVTGGGPTEDKPSVTFAAPDDPNRVSHAMTVRVPDCKAAHELLLARGAEFLTPPVDHGFEVRCFLTDPDGHLIELSEVGP